ncbi:hypothetical protein KI387_008651, partial [Taxus chinensis]
MDSEGVWKYMAEHRRDVQAVTVEMRPALESAIDPARLVLEAIEDQRRACRVLLESLLPILENPIMGEDHPIIAKVLRSGLRPLQINGSQRLLDGELANAKLLEVQAFLQLLATFGIAAEFERDFMCKLFMSVSWRKYIAKLYGALGLSEIMPRDDRCFRGGSCKFIHREVPSENISKLTGGEKNREYRESGQDFQGSYTTIEISANIEEGNVKSISQDGLSSQQGGFFLEENPTEKGKKQLNEASLSERVMLGWSENHDLQPPVLKRAWSLTGYIYVMPVGVVLSFFDLENLLFLYRMDSEGVWKYMAEHRRDVQGVTIEMRPTLESAVDPARLVLEAIEGPYGPEKGMPRAIGILVARFGRSNYGGGSSHYCQGFKERAKATPDKWKSKIVGRGAGQCQALGGSGLLTAFGYLRCFRGASCRFIHREVPSENISKLTGGEKNREYREFGQDFQGSHTAIEISAIIEEGNVKSVSQDGLSSHQGGLFLEENPTEKGKKQLNEASLSERVMLGWSENHDLQPPVLKVSTDSQMPEENCALSLTGYIYVMPVGVVLSFFDL